MLSKIVTDIKIIKIIVNQPSNDYANRSVGEEMHDNRFDLMKGLDKLFLKAAIDSSLWHCALDTMAQLSGSSRAQLAGISNRGDLAFNVMTNIDETFTSDFLRIAGHHDPLVNYRVGASVRTAPGTVIWEQQYAVIQARNPDSAYQEACERHDLLFGCQTNLILEQGFLVGLALMRTRKEGQTTPEQREFFASAAIAAQSAMRLRRAIDDRGTAITHGALELVGQPVLLVDGFGKVAEMTSLADTIVASHPAIDIQEHMLVAARQADTQTLNRLLRTVLDRQQLDASMLLRSPGTLPLLVKIQALPTTETGFGFQPRALISLGGSADDAAGSGRLLREHYELTVAESEVVALLAQGMPRADIARRRGTSLGTVRQQIKTVFAKTGVSREAELLALVSGLGR